MTIDSLAQVWSTVLGLDVDASTDFFISGGDSLAVAELQTLLEEDFHLRVDGSTLIKNSTLQEFFDTLSAMPGRVA